MDKDNRDMYFWVQQGDNHAGDPFTPYQVNVLTCWALERLANESTKEEEQTA